ncbi:unnamed protein product [Hymenolepis diminuta]|uniref:Mitochondrial carrier homolog 2 n=1 Tax=Hymenolepis diminuta TaxID=6216 RepID=A0A0R3S866_HYMDI|nr:unnamed protein product [Hymenolepis diminuta]
MDYPVALSSGSVTKLCYDYVIPTALSTVCHPFVTARTLMMLGYEFEQPKLGRNIIGLQRYMYPNVFNYLGHLREEVGLFRLFTVGLPASVVGSSIKSSICEFYLKQHVAGYVYKKSVIETEFGFRVFLKETTKLTIARCLGLLVSYPFQVIMIRQMAQLVGNETIYSSILQAFVEINANEGLPGLLSGLIPRLLGEVITVWLTAGMAYIVNRYLIPEGSDPKFKEQTPYIASSLWFAYSGFDVGPHCHATYPINSSILHEDGLTTYSQIVIVSSCTHRLTVTSTVMAVSGSGLSVDVPFKNSLECYNYLSTRNAFLRGASFFFRYAAGPL